MPDKAARRIQKRLEKQKRSKNDAFSTQPILQAADDEEDYVIFSLKDLVSGYDLDNSKCTE